MDTDRPSTEYKDKFQLIFVEMFWRDDSDPIYKDWTEGRIEIRKWDDQYGNDEIRYCTKKNAEWFTFQNKYNLTWLSADELNAFKKEVSDKFKKSPQD
jgi:hypothetical protein